MSDCKGPPRALRADLGNHSNHTIDICLKWPVKLSSLTTPIPQCHRAHPNQPSHVLWKENSGNNGTANALGLCRYQ